MLELDTIVWEPGQIAVERHDDLVFADLARFCHGCDGWVIDGCYADLVEATLRFRPLLVFLDPGLAACVANCRARPWEPQKYRSKAEQDAQLQPLLGWVSTYYERDGLMSHAGHRALFEAYRGPKRRVTRLDELERRPVTEFSTLPAGRSRPAWLAR